MFRHHKYSLSDLSSPTFFTTTTSSPREDAVFSTAHIAQLANLDMLKVTLALSRNENYWRLLHSRDNPPTHKYSASECPQLRINTAIPNDDRCITMPPLSPGAIQKFISTPNVFMGKRGKEAPSDHDYERMLNRLDKVIHGSFTSLHSTVLTEGKPISLSLNPGEWHYLKVKTEGMKVPLQVSTHRSKGKLSCYLSKSSAEPTDLCYDEVYQKDLFEFAELGSKFHQKCITLGFRCIDEADFTVIIHFGSTMRKRKAVFRSDTLADLNELRRDEAKRQALFDQVEAVLSHREAERSAKFGERNYIRKNIVALSRQQSTDLQSRRDMEMRRRENAVHRRKLLLEEKKYRGLIRMKKKQLKMEEEEKEREEEDRRRSVEEVQMEWIQCAVFYRSLETLWSHFCKKRDKKNEFAKQMKAAMVLQRCYRKVLLTVNPKRLTRERALEHLKLFCAQFGPEIFQSSRSNLFLAIKDHYKTNRIALAAGRYYARSKVPSSYTDPVHVEEVYGYQTGEDGEIGSGVGDGWEGNGGGGGEGDDEEREKEGKGAGSSLHLNQPNPHPHIPPPDLSTQVLPRHLRLHFRSKSLSSGCQSFYIRQTKETRSCLLIRSAGFQVYGQ